MVSALLFNLLIQQDIVTAISYLLIFLLLLLPGIVIYLKNKDNNQKIRYDLLLAIIGFILVLIIYIVINAPISLIYAFIAGVLGGIGIAIISYYWDISLHAATTAGCAALFIAISWPTTLVLLFISVIVGSTRIPLKKHSVTQVIAGWIYGFGLTAALVLMFNSI